MLFKVRILKKFSTSKNIIFLVLIVFFLFIIFFINSQKDNNQNNNFVYVEMGETEKIVDIEKDSDGDGLKDWEEILWGFNPQEQDSDSDGIMDKEEMENYFSEDDKSLSDFENIKKSFPNKLSELFKSEEKKDFISNSSPENTPTIFSVEPKEGFVGTDIVLKGKNFTEKWNTIYAGYKIFYGIESLDGETLSFKFEPDLPEGISTIGSIPFLFIVENQNGESESVSFKLIFKQE